MPGDPRRQLAAAHGNQPARAALDQQAAHPAAERAERPGHQVGAVGAQPDRQRPRRAGGRTEPRREPAATAQRQLVLAGGRQLAGQDRRVVRSLARLEVDQLAAPANQLVIAERAADAPRRRTGRLDRRAGGHRLGAAGDDRQLAGELRREQRLRDDDQRVGRVRRGVAQLRRAGPGQRRGVEAPQVDDAAPPVLAARCDRGEQCAGVRGGPRIDRDRALLAILREPRSGPDQPRPRAAPTDLPLDLPRERRADPVRVRQHNPGLAGRDVRPRAVRQRGELDPRHVEQPAVDGRPRGRRARHPHPGHRTERLTGLAVDRDVAGGLVGASAR